jgi:hypothetical protein
MRRAGTPNPSVIGGRLTCAASCHNGTHLRSVKIPHGEIVESDQIIAAIRGIEHLITNQQDGWTPSEARMRVTSLVKQIVDSPAATGYIRGKAGRILEFCDLLFRDRPDTHASALEDVTASILGDCMGIKMALKRRGPDQ